MNDGPEAGEVGEEDGKEPTTRDEGDDRETGAEEKDSVEQGGEDGVEKGEQAESEQPEDDPEVAAPRMSDADLWPDRQPDQPEELDGDSLSAETLIMGKTGIEDEIPSTQPEGPRPWSPISVLSNSPCPSSPPATAGLKDLKRELFKNTELGQEAGPNLPAGSTDAKQSRISELELELKQLGATHDSFVQFEQLRSVLFRDLFVGFASCSVSNEARADGVGPCKVFCQLGCFIWQAFWTLDPGCFMFWRRLLAITALRAAT